MGGGSVELDEEELDDELEDDELDDELEDELEDELWGWSIARPL